MARLAEVGLLTAALLHEIRQPMFAIKAMAQLGGAEAVGSDAGRFDAILQQVLHLEELVATYGGLVRHDAAEERYDLHDVVRGAASGLAWRARRLGIALDLSLAPGAAWVVGRAGGMRQVLVNLLQNALDAVEARPGAGVRVSTEVGERVRLFVDDDGPGLPPEVAAQAFDAFFTTKPPDRGTGLGLYITRRIVEDAGGTITITASRTGGARIVLELPPSP